MGSIEQDDFRIETCLSNVWILVGDKPSQVTFQAFLQALLKNNLYALLRVQTRATSHQKLGVLRPVYDELGYYGMLQYIPYQQDVRNYPFPTLPIKENKTNTWKSALPGKMTLQAIEQIVKSSSQASFDPRQYHLLSWHHTYHTSLLKYLGLTPDLQAPQRLKQELAPTEELINAVNKYKDNIPEHERPAKIIKKSASKGAKLGIEGDLDEILKLSELDFTKPTVDINQETFMSDFQMGIDDPDLVTEAVEEMTVFIEQQIEAGDDDKATEAIQILRATCPGENESATFNNWLISLKTKNIEAFEYMKYKEIKPISEKEAKDSKLTEAWCNKFYTC